MRLPTIVSVEGENPSVDLARKLAEAYDAGDLPDAFRVVVLMDMLLTVSEAHGIDLEMLVEALRARRERLITHEVSLSRGGEG